MLALVGLPQQQLRERVTHVFSGDCVTGRRRSLAPRKLRNSILAVGLLDELACRDREGGAQALVGDPAFRRLHERHDH
jgi:hypothetical protein